MENILGNRFHEVIETMYREDDKIIIICKSNFWAGKKKIIIQNTISETGFERLDVSITKVE